MIKTFIYSKYRFSIIFVLSLLISVLPGCGEDAFNGGEDPDPVPDPVVDPPDRFPDPSMVPDCGTSIDYDMGGTNGFGLQKIVNSVSYPTDMAFIPGSPSAFIVLSQNGNVSFFNGSCNAINSINLSNAASGGIGVDTGGEQGLLNVEFHPDYANTGYLFFYHTTNGGLNNAISRMTLSFSSSGSMELSDPVKIIDFRKDGLSTNHNGGGLVFAPDNTILASVGDADGGNGQMNNKLLGVVVRVAPSLTPGVGGYNIPAGNMFSQGNTRCSDIVGSPMPCPEILAMGLRNPFRMSIDGNIVYIGDVGQNIEEINSFDYSSVNKVNFGWPAHDGYVASSTIVNYRNPVIYYDRFDALADSFRAEDPEGNISGLASVMVGDVYSGTQYMNLLDGKLLFAEFYDGFMRATGVDNNGEIIDNDGVPGDHIKHQVNITSMLSNHDGFIYITYFENGGTVYRLVRP